eukprot:s2608_g3.t1
MASVPLVPRRSRGLVVGQALPVPADQLSSDYKPLQGLPERRLARLAGLQSAEDFWIHFDRLDLIGTSAFKRQKVEVFWGSFLDVPIPLGSSVYVCNGKSVTRWCPGRKDRKPYHFHSAGYRKHRCDGHRFPLGTARLVAGRLLRFGGLERYKIVVLCGRCVAAAFGLRMVNTAPDDFDISEEVIPDWDGEGTYLPSDDPPVTLPVQEAHWHKLWICGVADYSTERRWTALVQAKDASTTSFLPRLCSGRPPVKDDVFSRQRISTEVPDGGDLVAITLTAAMERDSDNVTTVVASSGCQEVESHGDGQPVVDESLAAQASSVSNLLPMLEFDEYKEVYRAWRRGKTDLETQRPSACGKEVVELLQAQLVVAAEEDRERQESEVAKAEMMNTDGSEDPLRTVVGMAQPGRPSPLVAQGYPRVIAEASPVSLPLRVPFSVVLQLYARRAEGEVTEAEEQHGIRFLVLPHPSGVSHFWNDEVSWHRAALVFRAALRVAGLPPQRAGEEECAAGQLVRPLFGPKSLLPGAAPVHTRAWCRRESGADFVGGDRELVAEACWANGLALQHAPPELRNDWEVVMCAVSKSGTALMWASSELQADQEVVLKAVEENGGALEYAAQESDDFLSLFL